ncbi:thioesterase superfamily protein [Parathielavia appendiculata]|uniref:Thioesterase superfamily protein n=1 Tax=Parathielavia appendiculata TaxID=2587402 RepID=A0AAN6Z0Q2_9PEZI|nr:thioesterase superfamily protein [Parathielavia appendiculata]
MALQQANAAAAARQIAYFRAIPWCASLLSQPNLVMDQSVSRRLSHTARDTLLSRTLNSAEAIPAYITFYPRPSPSSTPPASASEFQPQPHSTESSQPLSGSPNSPNFIRELKSFVALGPGLNGWEGICHGGMVVTLLDEVMGQVFAANKAHGLLADMPVMTGYLNTRFEKPVRTGTSLANDGRGASVVLITARLLRNEGRKYWMEGEVSNEGGCVMARAEALFIMLRGKL